MPDPSDAGVQPEQDEELPGRRAGGGLQFGGRSRLRRDGPQRLRRDVVLGAVVLAGGLLFARVAAHHGSPRTTPSSHPSPLASADSSAVAAPGLPARRGDDPADCPGLQCTTVASVPAQVVAAVREVFPAARIGAVETVRLVTNGAPGPLWFREVNASVSGRTLQLRIEAHASGDRPAGGFDETGAGTVTFYESPREQWFVHVQVQTPAGIAQALPPLVRLAADPRVLVAG